MNIRRSRGQHCPSSARHATGRGRASADTHSRPRYFLTFDGELVQNGDAICQGTSGALASLTVVPSVWHSSRRAKSAQNSCALRRSCLTSAHNSLSECGRAFASGSASAKSRLPKSRGCPCGWCAPMPLRFAAVWTGKSRRRRSLRHSSLVVELTFRVGTSAPEALRRLRLTAPTDSEHGIPKSMAIYLDAGERGDRFRFWTQGEMGPDGLFDTGNLAGCNARWIRVVIRSAWTEGTMAMDRIVVE